MQNRNWQGHRAKNLAGVVNRCFQEVVGNPPNETHAFNSENDIAFIMDSLNDMVNNYLEFKKGTQPGRGVPADFIAPIMVKNEADIEKIILAIDKAMQDKFGRQRPEGRGI